MSKLSTSSTTTPAVPSSLNGVGDGVGTAPLRSTRHNRPTLPQLDSSLYPANCFHTPTLIDLPARKRKLLTVINEAQHVITGVDQNATERRRVAPERLIITEKGHQVKRLKLTDNKKMREEEQEKNTTSAASSPSTTITTSNNNKPGDNIHGKTSSISSNSSKSIHGKRTHVDKSQTTSHPDSPSSMPPSKPNTNNDVVVPNYKSFARKHPLTLLSSSFNSKSFIHQIGDSSSPSSSSSSRSHSRSRSHSTSPSSLSPIRGRKRPSSSCSGSDSNHLSNNLSIGSNSSSNNTAAIIAKRLALERLELNRSRSTGSYGNPLRHTRLAAAASMVVEADFASAGEMIEDHTIETSAHTAKFRLTSPSPIPVPSHASDSTSISPSTQSFSHMSTFLSSGRDDRDDGSDESHPIDLTDDPPHSLSTHPFRLTPSPPSASSSSFSSLPLTIVLPDNFFAVPRLPESALRRLSLSNTNKAIYLSFEWVHKRCMKYLSLRTVEQQYQHDELAANASNKEFVAKLRQCGTLTNGRLYISVSRRSDHVQFWLDEEAKEIANRASNLRRSASSTSDTDDEDGRKLIPMLGLFAGVDLPEGTWLTQYGGVLQWGGVSEGSVKNRAKECNTHVRRISNTDHVWDGRPWSLLFPRIPSFLQREMTKPLHARMKLAPIVNNRSLINLLLLLHHEDQTHTLQNSHVPFDGQKNNLLPFTVNDMKSPSVCQGTCHICRNELNVLLTTLGGRSYVGQLTHDDILATFLPQCACCSVTVGLLPCEIHEIFSKWSITDQEALWQLCQQIQNDIVTGGLGYMANTDMKQKQNVRVFSRSPYLSSVSDMYPLVHIYQTTKLIKAGEEVYVAYNNNESKQM